MAQRSLPLWVFWPGAGLPKAERYPCVFAGLPSVLSAQDRASQPSRAEPQHRARYPRSAGKDESQGKVESRTSTTVHSQAYLIFL